MAVVCFTLKTFLTILAIFVARFSFGQAASIYTFRLLRLKDAVKLSYAVKSKEFHKAISFRDSAMLNYQTNKKVNWIALAGTSYYNWEGFAHYNNENDTIELWEAQSERPLIAYSSFIDLNNDGRLDIIFSNIYDQFLKTQSNWTDIYFKVKEKYIPIMLKGYLISLTKKNKSIILLETVEQPLDKLRTQFVLHTYEINTKTRVKKETAIKSIARGRVKQYE